MFESKSFTKLVDKGQPTAEVVAMNDFVVSTTMLADACVYAVVLFAGGAQGVIWQVHEETLDILLLNDTPVRAGELLVLLNPELNLGVGKQLLGRVVNPLGKPLDGKGFVPTTAQGRYFRPAPSFHERAMVEQQLESGVTVVDTLLPLVKGQRMAIMGDSKSGKTSFLTQVAIQQARAGQIVVYVLVAKPRTELTRLVQEFTAAKVLKSIVLVVSDTMEPLPVGFLAPYAGCAIAEHFWYAKQDVMVIYDDFSNHAKLYREMALLLNENVGREAYPGDMFHVHSALLERAGKLQSTNTALTAMAIGTTPNNDLTGYQATSLISMSDGQIVFDLETMHKGVQPAININLSVSRIGGRSHNPSMQKIAGSVLEELAHYQTALDFTRFGDQASAVARREIAFGQRLYEVFHQRPGESYTLVQQRLMLQAVLELDDPSEFDVTWLKKTVQGITAQSLSDDEFDKLAGKLIRQGMEGGR